MTRSPTVFGAGTGPKPGNRARGGPCPDGAQRGKRVRSRARGSRGAHLPNAFVAGVFEPPECVRRQGDSRIHHTSSSGPQVSAQVSLRDAPVPGSDAQVPGGDAQVPLRDLAGEARRRGGHAAETLMGRVHQVALRYARGRLGRFGAEDLAQDAAQEVCMAVHTALPDYDERGAPFEAFAYTIASRKVARRGRPRPRPHPHPALAAAGDPRPPGRRRPHDRGDRRRAGHERRLGPGHPAPRARAVTTPARPRGPYAIGARQHAPAARQRAGVLTSGRRGWPGSTRISG